MKTLHIITRAWNAYILIDSNESLQQQVHHFKATRHPHLKDFKVVLRFFKKVFDCNIHSLFVPRHTNVGEMLVLNPSIKKLKLYQSTKLKCVFSIDKWPELTVSWQYSTHPEKRSKGQYRLCRFHFPLANCRGTSQHELQGSTSSMGTHFKHSTSRGAFQMPLTASTLHLPWPFC